LQTAIELQDLFSAILRSDRDGDAHLSESEMDEFLARIKAFAATKKTGGRQQLTFDEETVRQAFGKSLRHMTVQSLINVTSTMMDDDEEQQAGGPGAADEAMALPQKNPPPPIVVTTVGDDESCMEPTSPSQEGSATNPVDVTGLV
jgi:hypothetical protein